MNADITLFTAACTGSPKNNVYPNETIITDKVHCVFTGKKILVDLDALLKYLSGESESFS